MIDETPAEPRSFEVGTRRFEIRVARIADSIEARCFEQGRDIGVRASVDVDTASDFRRYGLGNATLAILDALERYVRNAIEQQSRDALG